MEARKTEIVMGDCIKSDHLERMRKIIDRSNWRLPTEDVVREK